MTEAHTPENAEKRPDIQGMRGVAVLAVLLYHAASVVMPGGFAGVDIFFVLSGFLITRILLGSMDAGRFSLREFYRRRVRRLFPALYVVLCVTLVLGLIILPPKLLSELAFTQFFTSLFLSNFAFSRLAGYFDTAASLKPLLHTWSLGVEEQFYLVYPLVLLAIHKFAARFLWPALIALTVLAFGVAEVSLVVRPEASFYLPTSRAFELLLGALCVGAERRWTLSAGLRRILSLGGLVLIIGSLAGLRDTLPFPGLFALPACLGTACLLVAKGGWAGRLLSAPPLTATGDMSYSLYLWHWPLLVYSRMLFGDVIWVTVVAIVLAFGLAWLSRRYVELPFLEGRIKPVWVWGGAAMAVSIGAALLIFSAAGLPARFNAAEQAAFAAADDYNHMRKGCHVAKGERLAYAKTCTYGDPKAEPSVAVWGDSHGAELSMALGQRLATDHRALRQVTSSACPPSVGFQTAFNLTCREHNADMLLHLKSDRRIATVILVTDYLRYEDDQRAAVLGGLELSAIDLLTAGKQVVIVYPTPRYAFDPPSQAGMAMRLGQDPASIGMTRAQFDHDNGAIIAELDAFTADHGIAVLRPSDVLCDAQACHIWDKARGVLYFNGQHLSVTGAGVLVERLTIPAPPPPAR